MNYQTQAIVLKSFKAGEFDRIYWVFSAEKGKINFIAKGIRKPLAKLSGGLEPLTQAEIFLVEGRKMDRAVGVAAIDQFPEIRKNLEKNVRARSVLELLFHLETEPREAEKLFQQVEKYLSELEKGSLSREKTDLLSLGVLWKIIFLSGWAVDFYHCCFCGEKLSQEKNNYFCFCRGIGCGECLEQRKGVSRRIKVGQGEIKVLRFFQEKDLDVFKKLKLSPVLIFDLKKLTKAYLDEIIDKKLLDLWF